MPFCASHPDVTFCDDFDNPSKPLKILWDEVTVTGAGVTPVADSSLSRSPEMSLFATTTDIESGQSASSGVKKLLTANASATSNVHFEYAIYLDEVLANGHVYYTRLAFGPNPTAKKYKMYLVMDDGIPYLDQETPDDANGVHTSQMNKLEILLLPARWYDVAVDVSFGTKTITVKVDGSTVGTAPFIAGFITGDVSALAGIEYAPGPSPAVRAHFDNVLLDVK